MAEQKKGAAKSAPKEPAKPRVASKETLVKRLARIGEQIEKLSLQAAEVQSEIAAREGDEAEAKRKRQAKEIGKVRKLIEVHPRNIQEIILASRGYAFDEAGEIVVAPVEAEAESTEE